MPDRIATDYNVIVLVACNGGFLDPETGLQALRTLFFSLVLVLALRLFHLTTNRRQT